MATTETRKMVLAAAAICDEKKAENTRVLELDPADSGFTDFFLITSGTNTRQTVAIADDIELKMKREFATYPNSVEGRRTGEWILMDYVDFVVHIFVEEKRAFYDIERLRKSARSIDLPQLKAALSEKTAAARRAHPLRTDTTAVEDTPNKTPTSRRRSPSLKAVSAKKVAQKAVKRRSVAKKSANKAPATKSATRIAAAAEASEKTVARKKSAKAPTKKTVANRTRSDSAE
jgi:ribosome-associated protein